jgi:hypothetical protein
MRVLIVVAQNTIIIDGRGMALDCTSLRSKQISALRWYGDHGEIEYVGSVRPLAQIMKLDAFQPDGFTVQGLVDAAKPFGKGAK